MKSLSLTLMLLMNNGVVWANSVPAAEQREVDALKGSIISNVNVDIQVKDKNGNSVSGNATDIWNVTYRDIKEANRNHLLSGVRFQEIHTKDSITVSALDEYGMRYNKLRKDCQSKGGFRMCRKSLL